MFFGVCDGGLVFLFSKTGVGRVEFNEDGVSMRLGFEKFVFLYLELTRKPIEASIKTIIGIITRFLFFIFIIGLFFLVIFYI